jgi:regulator of sigma E protease
MTALSFVFAFVLMLGVLIFVHELGHFLVAKLFDVKVLKFSLGFGPAIGVGRWRLAFRRGETEYVVAWFPLGGFVKMLGENPDEEAERLARAEAAARGEDVARPDDPEGQALRAMHDPIDPADVPRAFHNKPVWQRLLILFAGPGMNLLLPVLIFWLVLATGMPRPEPVIGTVEPASPAARADLRVGDRILAVAGEPVRWWDDVEDLLRERPQQRVPIRFERAGAPLDAALELEERSGTDLAGAPAKVGFAGLGHARLAAVIGIPDANAPAARSELRSGDRVLAVNGEEVADWEALASAYAAAGAQGTAVLRVERAEADAGADGEARRSSELVIEVPATGSVGALGIVPATVLVAAVTPDSPADRAGLRSGDLIVAVDGGPIGSFASFSELVRGSGGRALDLVYARAGERHEVRVQPQLLEADTGLGIPEERYLIGITAHAASIPGAVGEDREANPLVAIPRAVEMTGELTKSFLAGLSRLATGEVSRKQLAGPIGIAEIAHNAFERGWHAYLTTLVLISINLAILNLLPIPVLDGGQALLISIEGIMRSPLSLRTREIVQSIGITVLMMLMGLAFWNDLSRHWSRFVDWVRQSAGL